MTRTNRDFHPEDPTAWICSFEDALRVRDAWRRHRYDVYAGVDLVPDAELPAVVSLVISMHCGLVRATWSVSATVLEGGFKVRSMRKVLDGLSDAVTAGVS